MASFNGMLDSVRKNRPLVLQIANNVTANDCANATICAGGSPIMTTSDKEIEELVSKASAFVINIGTVNECIFKTMMDGAKAANDCGVPIILDPVGVNASEYRYKCVKKILKKTNVSVIKGNSAEIKFISEGDSKSVGLDSLEITSPEIVFKLGKKLGAIICSTGNTDAVSNGKETLVLSNGNEMMGLVSGTGCMLSSVVGCFVGALRPTVKSVSGAVTFFNVAGEKAMKKSNGPGTLKMNILDEMMSMKDSELDEKLRIA